MIDKTSKKYERLPNWIKEKIKSLELKNNDLNIELNKLINDIPKFNVKVINGCNKQDVYLPENSHIRFKTNDGWIEVSHEIIYFPNDFPIKICSNYGLVVQPWASNVIKIKDLKVY